MERRVSIEVLVGQYSGQTAWVIGSGPSLLRLSIGDIGVGPVLAINTAIRRVETLGLSNPVYSLQKDARFAACRAPVLAHQHESAKLDGFGDYVFDNLAFGLAWNMPSVCSALGIAHLWGCRTVVYMCCDAAVNADLRRCVGEEIVEAGKPHDYLAHRGLVERFASEIGFAVEWRLPTCF